MKEDSKSIFQAGVRYPVTFSYDSVYVVHFSVTESLDKGYMVKTFVIIFHSSPRV